MRKWSIFYSGDPYLVGWSDLAHFAIFEIWQIVAYQVYLYEFNLFKSGNARQLFYFLKIHRVLENLYLKKGFWLEFVFTSSSFFAKKFFLRPCTMLKKTLKVKFCTWGPKTIWHNISFPNFCSQKTLHPCTSCLAQNILTLAVLYVTLTYRVQCTGHIRLL